MPEADDRRPPEPPDDLGRRALPSYAVPAGSHVARVHSAARGPLWFGPAVGGAPQSRFDDPERATRAADTSFGTCYLAARREGAFAEGFLRHPGMRLLPRATFDARALSDLEVMRALRVAALFGPGLAGLGATAAVSHGPHAVARRWARALWAHPDCPDGIAYRCRHDDDELAVALFDRAADALVVRATRPVRADRAWFGAMLDRYGIGLVD